MSTRQQNNNNAAAAAAIAASNNLSPSNYQSNTNVSNIPQYSQTNLQPQSQNQSQSQIQSSPQQQQQLQQQSNSSSNSSSQVVGLHYKIGKKIGEGSFGVIFEGTNLINGVPVAIKFEPRKAEAPQLRDEYRTYKHLNGTVGIPNAYYFGQEGLHNILVIDLLGPSLEDLFDWCGRKFSIKTVVQISVQMITLIERVHQNDLIYRDIKPDNFLIGRQGLPDENNVHLVDFGMAKQYRDPRTKQHIPYREKKSLSGTARYMSVNTHLGREQSRRDDLEALGHVFFYFLRGQLPWQGLKAPTNKQKYEKIGEKKRTTPINELCNALPIQFGRYLESVRNLQFDAEPDYEHYRQLILSVLPEIGEVADGHYDWMDLNNGRGWDANINKKPNLHGYGHPNPPGEKRQHQKRSKAHNHHNNNTQNPQIPQQQLQQSQQQTQLQQQLQQQHQQQQYQQQQLQQQSQPQIQQHQSYQNEVRTNPIISSNVNDTAKPLPNLPEQSYGKPNDVNKPNQAKLASDEDEEAKGCFGKLLCC